MMDRLTVMGSLEGLTQDDWEQWYSDSEVQETAKAALSLLKEQDKEIKKLRTWKMVERGEVIRTYEDRNEAKWE